MCCIPMCENKIVAKTLCRKHYLRQYRHGSTDKSLRGFRSKTHPSGVGSVNKSNGYHEVVIGYDYTTRRAIKTYMHRKVWSDAFGPIPKGFQIHHINGHKLDNSLDNLQLMSHSEHAKFHYHEKMHNEVVCIR